MTLSRKWNAKLEKEFYYKYRAYAIVSVLELVGLVWLIIKLVF